MSYAEFDLYQSLYPCADESTYHRLSWEAARELDRQTTGLDNVRKLKIAFPADEEAAEAVRRCECELVHLMAQIEEAEKVRQEAHGLVQQEDGTVKGKVVTSVSSGSESISYSTGGNTGTTAIDAAAGSTAARNVLFADTVRKYLSGVTDANGVNLLYMGAYPHV